MCLLFMYEEMLLTYFMLQAKYHAEFEKTKGKLTQVADDPETLRIKANSKIIRYKFLLNLFILALISVFLIIQTDFIIL